MEAGEPMMKQLNLYQEVIKPKGAHTKKPIHENVTEKPRFTPSGVRNHVESFTNIYKAVNGMLITDDDPSVEEIASYFSSIEDKGDFYYNDKGFYKDACYTRSLPLYLIQKFSSSDKSIALTRAIQRFGLSPKMKDVPWRDIIARFVGALERKHGDDFKAGECGSTYDSSTLDGIIEYTCFSINTGVYAIVSTLEGGSPFSDPSPPFVFDIDEADEPYMPRDDDFYVSCDNGCWAVLAGEGGYVEDVARLDNDVISSAIDPNYPKYRQTTLEECFMDVPKMIDEIKAHARNHTVLWAFNYLERAQNERDMATKLEDELKNITYAWIWKGREKKLKCFIKRKGDDDDDPVCAFCGSKIVVEGE